MKKGFTLLELLIVVGIISLLLTVGTSLYSFSQKKSRDSRRKADLENIRIALESYRSNSAQGNYPANLNILITPPAYIPKIPVDPLSSTYIYYYTASGSDYTIGAYSELGGSCPATYDCGQVSGVQACRYCLGPYGQK